MIITTRKLVACMNEVDLESPQLRELTEACCATLLPVMFKTLAESKDDQDFITKMNLALEQTKQEIIIFQSGLNGQEPASMGNK
jgi:hypothetical protein